METHRQLPLSFAFGGAFSLSSVGIPAHHVAWAYALLIFS